MTTAVPETETISICRYLDELHPEPPLFGTTPFERAETDMWIRRVEAALGHGLQHRGGRRRRGGHHADALRQRIGIDAVGLQRHQMAR